MVELEQAISELEKINVLLRLILEKSNRSYEELEISLDILYGISLDAIDRVYHAFHSLAHSK